MNRPPPIAPLPFWLAGAAIILAVIGHSIYWLVKTVLLLRG